VFEFALFQRHLGRRIDVLQGAAAADAEMRAARFDPMGRGPQHVPDAADGVIRLGALYRRPDPLARQRALDEEAPAIARRDAARLIVQRFDVEIDDVLHDFGCLLEGCLGRLEADYMCHKAERSMCASVGVPASAMAISSSVRSMCSTCTTPAAPAAARP